MALLLLEAPPELELGAALESALGCAALEFGCAALELELELGVLEPPEAEPELDFEASLEDDPPGVTPIDVLDELEPGWADAPPVPPAELDEDGEDGVALLELDEPGAPEVRSVALSRLQAERPKANATASVRTESFMYSSEGS